MSAVSVLVCVTQQKTCERLIREGSRIASSAKGILHVIHVARKDLNFLNNTSEGDALQYLFNVSNAAGASLTVLKSENITKAIADYAISNSVTDIVLGAAPTADKKENDFPNMLKKALQSVEFHIITP